MQAVGSEEKIVKVSAIVSNYNGESVLKDTLSLLARQEYDFFEIVFVDDASTDNSAAIAGNLLGKKAVIIVNKKNKGPAYCKNAGARASSGEWLFFMDNDTFLEDGDVVKNLLYAALSYNVVSIQPKIYFLNNRTVINSAGGIANIYGYAWDRGIYEKDEGQYDSFEKVVFNTTAAMLVKRDIFFEAGGFDASYFYLNEDYDLGMRLNMCGYDIGYTGSVSAFHKQSHTMKRDNLRVKFLMERNRIITLLKNYEFKTLVKIFKKLFLLRKERSAGIFRRFGIGAAFVVVKILISILILFPSVFFKRRRFFNIRKLSDAEFFDKFKKWNEVKFDGKKA